MSSKGSNVDAESGARFKTAGGESMIVTAASVSGPAEKRMLADRYQADVVDMESAAVAAVAQERGIEFGAMKAMSDELEFEMPPVAALSMEMESLKPGALCNLHCATAEMVVNRADTGEKQRRPDTEPESSVGTNGSARRQIQRRIRPGCRRGSHVDCENK